MLSLILVLKNTMFEPDTPHHNWLLLTYIIIAPLKSKMNVLLGDLFDLNQYAIVIPLFLGVKGCIDNGVDNALLPTSNSPDWIIEGWLNDVDTLFNELETK